MVESREETGEPREPTKTLEEAIGNRIRDITGEELDPDKLAAEAERIRSGDLTEEELDQLEGSLSENTDDSREDVGEEDGIDRGYN